MNPAQSHMMPRISQSAADLQHAARFGPTLAQRCDKGGPGEKRQPSTTVGGRHNGVEEIMTLKGLFKNKNSNLALSWV